MKLLVTVYLLNFLLISFYFFAVLDMFPAAVYISREGQHICGGTRIRDIVLTAAHCVINSSVINK